MKSSLGSVRARHWKALNPEKRTQILSFALLCSHLDGIVHDDIHKLVKALYGSRKELKLARALALVRRALHAQ